MPTTEVPTSPPGAPPEPPRFSRVNRYDDYSTHDLLSVIEDLEGSRNWVSLREKLWIAIILHMILLWFLIYGPKYVFHQRVRVVNPSELMKQNQMTYLETPNDIKPMKPKPTPLISNKNHVAETPHPTLDKKTLEELEAMRRAGPPAPRPTPETAAPKPAEAPPQPVPRAAQPKPPAQPLPANAKSQIEAPTPTPAPTKPNFNTGASTPGQEIEQMERNAARSSQYGGDMGAGAPSEHPGNQGAVDVLSDTMGVDFGPYIERVIYDTKRAWYPIIPEEAQPPLLKQGRVGISFRILPNGTVAPGSMHLDAPSGDVALDKAAWAAINYAGYPPLPKEFKGKYLELRFYFLYNIRPGQE